MSVVTGLVVLIVDLAVLSLGSFLCLVGTGLVRDGSGKSGIRLMVSSVGEMTRGHGQVVIFVAGTLMILAVLAYALKAYQQTRRTAGGLTNLLTCFSPLENTDSRYRPEDVRALSLTNESCSFLGWFDIS